MYTQVKSKNTALFLLVFLLSSCCNFHPQPTYFRQPPAEPVASAQEEVLEQGSATLIDGWLKERWWEDFNDPQLDALIMESLQQHPTMVIAEARIRDAEALRNSVRAPLFPSINALGDYTRIHNSEHGIFCLSPLFPPTYTQPEALINFSYEFDFWRKHRNLVGAAGNEVEAQLADAYYSRLLLSLAVAATYFEWQVGAARQELAEQIQKNREEFNLLVAKQAEYSLVSERETNEANQDFFTSVQYVQQQILLTKTAFHELQALLAADFNQYIELNPDLAASLRDPFPLPECLPLNLIVHRADVWASMRRAEGAAKKVCAAKAEFYPNVNLLAFIGLQTITPSNFFQAKSWYGSIGPAFSLPIFEGGAIQANYDSKRAEYVMAVAEYEKQMLEAVKEVLTAVVALEKSDKLLQAAQETESFAKKNVAVTRSRMLHHLSSKVDLLNDEHVWLLQKDIVLQSLLGCFEARLNLVRSLGGGF